MQRRTSLAFLWAFAIIPLPAPMPRAAAAGYDLIIRNGAIYDGNGNPPTTAALRQ